MPAKDKSPSISALGPRAELRHVMIHEPDFEYDKDGVYKAVMYMDAEEAQEFIEDHAELYEAAETLMKEMDKKRKPADRKKNPARLQDIGSLVYEPIPEDAPDDFEPEPTGEVSFNFKTKTFFKGRDGSIRENVVKVYDRKGEQIPNDERPKIGNGSIGRIRYFAKPYWIPGSGMAGVAFYLEAIKILELKQGFSHDMGGEEEGTFSYSDSDDNYMGGDES